MKVGAGLEACTENMVYLKEGLMKALITHYSAMGVLWLRDRLQEQCRSGMVVEIKKMDKEFTILTDMTDLPKKASQRAAGLQPVALAPAFNGAYGCAIGMDPAQSFGSLPGPSQTPPPLPFMGQGHGTGQGYGTDPPGGSYRGARGSGHFAPGHYGLGGGGRFGGGRGGSRSRGYGGQPPFCGKCQQAGSADIRHSHTACALTICFMCQLSGRPRPNCPN